jgi:putative hydrolase of HD superfamily
MDAPSLAGILEFLRSAERLKDTTRTAYTSEGRQETVAAHTWRLCLMALAFEDHFPEVDFGRLIKMCIIHDLGEAISGDIPAIHQDPEIGKGEQERLDLLELLRPLPEGLRTEITGLWDEYEQASTEEARLAKALDKLETILQHNQGKNPADFDYRFNLGYGRKYTVGDPVIVALRQILDEETEERARESDEREP